MFKAVLRVLVIAIMLFAFVGQTVAFNSAIPCEASENSHPPHASETAKNYDLNMTHTDSEENCCGIDCCNIDCICIANACSSIVYFSIEVNSADICTLSDVVYTQQPKQTISMATLLYRPPILIS
ncbi:hypothetical protein [Cognaticolwellia mytili]|uniref:hypothetical protein n=1 Tax=Cognaticolwellia mytili TaxID=1888913 RepID=UPI000A173F15|nr:hypothetical protein [Cognaticolwellia mytili]